MNKFVILTLLAVALCLKPDLEFDRESYAKFQKFIKDYGKKYNSVEEYMARFRVFKDNLSRINANGSSNFGVTKFSDMTENEFARKYLNLDITILNTIKFDKVNVQKRNDLPENFNWMDQQALGPIKDQGSCGSCWAFSTVANIEGLYKVKKNETYILSEQNLVDCDDNGDQGCNGGIMENSFAWIEKNGGLNTEKDYPYKGYDQSCKQDTEKLVAKITGFEILDDDDEEVIKSYLVETAPLAIALNANPLQFYSGGILDLTKAQCNPAGLNHAVTLVGYGVENGKDYWIVRNSWGKTWGEKGYFRIARGKGTCGINTYISTAKLE